MAGTIWMQVLLQRTRCYSRTFTTSQSSCQHLTLSRSSPLFTTLPWLTLGQNWQLQHDPQALYSHHHWTAPWFTTGWVSEKASFRNAFAGLQHDIHGQDQVTHRLLKFPLHKQHLPCQLNEQVNKWATSFSHQSVQLELLINKVENKKHCRHVGAEKRGGVQTEALWWVLALHLRSLQRTQT